MRSIIKKSILFAAAMASLTGGQQVYAQCFDLTRLDDRSVFQCINYDLKIVDQDEDRITYGWVPSASPEDHPRQTLITEQGKDGLCKELSVLPPNGKTSVRLASDAYQEKDSAKAEVGVYYINVPADKSLILLNYAAVMHTPGHEVAKSEGFEDYAQPNIHVDVIRLSEESQDVLTCPSVRFYPADSASVADWKVGEDTLGNPLIWKDWTTLPIDLSDYVGERVAIMVTAYDCAEESYDTKTKHISLCMGEQRHQARVYFSLDCGHADIRLQQTCSRGDSVTLTAPAAYTDYKWYDKAQPERIVSTDHVIRILLPESDATYCCEVATPCGPKVLEALVRAKEIHTDRVSLGYGETYTWEHNGETYTHSTNVSDTIPSLVSGCDSVIYNLRLSIKADSCHGVFTMVHDSVCADMPNVGILADYTVGSLDTYDLLFSKAAKDEGFEDVKGGKLDTSDTINIPIKNSIPKALFQGKDSLRYPRPGTYEVTLVEKNSCGFEFTHNLRFTLLYPARIIFQRWEDVLSVANEDYNGGYTFTDYRWFKNGKKVEGEGSWYNEPEKFDYRAQDEYWVELKRKGESEYVCSCHFTPSHQSNKTTFADHKGEIQLVPGRSGSERRLGVATPESGTYTIYDIWGRRLQSGVFGAEYGSPDIIMPAACTAGAYILLFLPEDGEAVTKKVTID